MTKLTGKLALSCVLLTVCGIGQADEIESVDRIRDVARDYIAEHVSGERSQIKMGRVDSRLRLARCNDDAIEAFSPPGSSPDQGRTTVGVRCNAPSPWRLFVSARVTVHKEVMVAQRPIDRGAVIEPDDVALESKDSSRIRGRAFSSEKPVVGARAKRPIRDGSVIRTNTVEAQQLVEDGVDVVIESSSNVARVQMRGVAKESGAEGEWIKVKNNSSGRIIDAKVIGERRVQAQSFRTSSR